MVLALGSKLFLQLMIKYLFTLSQFVEVECYLVDFFLLYSCLLLDFLSFSLSILPVQNGNLVAQDLRLVHVVRRDQDRAVLLVLQHQVPNVSL